MDTFPLEGDPIPEGYNGWLIFMDEFSSALRGVQAAAYKIVLDRQVGQFNLHPKALLAAAGNLDTDNAITEEMSTALQSRFVHYQLAIEYEAWLDWASEQKVDHRITDYIKFKPACVYTFKPDHSDRTYACPRTWMFTHRLIEDEPELSVKNDLAVLAGTISEGVAREFITFCSIYRDLPKLSDLIAAPTTIPIPGEPGVLWAMTGQLGACINEQNIDPLMMFVDRLPKEFQIFTLRDIRRRKPELNKTKAMQAWVVKNANELY